MRSKFILAAAGHKGHSYLGGTTMAAPPRAVFVGTPGDANNGHIYTAEFSSGGLTERTSALSTSINQFVDWDGYYFYDCKNAYAPCLRYHSGTQC